MDRRAIERGQPSAHRERRKTSDCARLAIAITDVRKRSLAVGFTEADD